MQVRMSLHVYLSPQSKHPPCETAFTKTSLSKKTASHRVCHYVSHALSVCIRSLCVLMASWRTVHKRSACQLHCTCGYYTNWWCRRTIAFNDINGDTAQKGFVFSRQTLLFIRLLYILRQAISFNVATSLNFSLRCVITIFRRITENRTWEMPSTCGVHILISGTSLVQVLELLIYRIHKSLASRTNTNSARWT
jgi:hypothetical protein